MPVNLRTTAGCSHYTKKTAFGRFLMVDKPKFMVILAGKVPAGARRAFRIFGTDNAHLEQAFLVRLLII
ncbi:MAG: hypothetical protein M1383_02365 [Patescibacteria group bacterium]|nr:hypothetical protein [Patescibacteria group bacterium]